MDANRLMTLKLKPLSITPPPGIQRHMIIKWPQKDYGYESHLSSSSSHRSHDTCLIPMGNLTLPHPAHPILYKKTATWLDILGLVEKEDNIIPSGRPDTVRPCSLLLCFFCTVNPRTLPAYGVMFSRILAYNPPLPAAHNTGLLLYLWGGWSQGGKGMPDAREVVGIAGECLFMVGIWTQQMRMKPDCEWPRKYPQDPLQAAAHTQVRLVTRCPVVYQLWGTPVSQVKEISAFCRGSGRPWGVSPISGRNTGSPNLLISTRSISSSPSCFSAVSPVSQGPGLLPGIWGGKVLLQLVLPPPGSGEPHGTCLPVAWNHTLHWKTERKKEGNFKIGHMNLRITHSCYPEHTRAGSLGPTTKPLGTKYTGHFGRVEPFPRLSHSLPVELN